MKEQSISHYYEADHDRLDDLFKNFQALKRSEFLRAKEFFVAFKFGLQRHIIWEEKILFPFFEEKTGIYSGGPTAVMRLEHRQIGEHLEAIHKKVQKADPNSDEEEKMLLAVLSVHNMKEENILYPAIDRAASESDREEVFQAMKEMKEERYAECCH
jgi:regulator of cell morphogenesis and NO signaling